MNNLNNIQELLRKKADLQTRLSLIPYTGTTEIKENKSGKYLYCLLYTSPSPRDCS